MSKVGKLDIWCENQHFLTFFKICSLDFCDFAPGDRH